MKKQSIGIIGAGIAGLSAGVHACSKGYNVTIYEQHSLPGGVCTAWKKGGFLIDGCIHWLMGCHREDALYKAYNELGIFEGITVTPVTHYTTFHWTEEGEGREHSLDITSDLAKLEADWLAIAPDDKTIILELVRAIRAFQAPGGDWMKVNAGFFQKLSFFWSIRKQLKYYGKYSISVRKFCERIKSPRLRHQLLNIFLDDVPVVFVLMILGGLTARSLGHVDQGSLQFALAIEAKFKALGGQIHYGKPVKKIIVENDTAQGVVLADGSEHRFDHVISAADQHETVFDLLDGRFESDEVRKRFESWRLFDPILMISFGLNHEFDSKVGPSHIFDLEKPIETGGGREEKNLTFRIFNRDKNFAPKGKSIIQVILGTDYDHWARLVKDRPAYDAEKARIAKEVLSLLDEYFAKVSDKVEMTDVATPHTFVRYTSNYRGAWEGWLISADNFGKVVPKQLKGLKHFWMTGQWTEPGGGIPAVVLSGREVIRLIEKAG